MKDFLGREYGPGDLVIYGASSGRCINMVIGRVVSVSQRQESNWEVLPTGKWGYVKTPMTDRDGNARYSVRIAPLHSSRWDQHSPPVHYIDNRTGEKIYQYAPEHVLSEAHYTLKSTGETVPSDACQYLKYVTTKGVGGYAAPQTTSVVNPDYVPDDLRTYHLTTFQPWVEKVTSPVKPVTIVVTENIVKWSGELPND